MDHHLTDRIAVSIERIATRAADLGDSRVEDLRDDALAQLVDPAQVFALAMVDARYWPSRALDRLLDDVYATHGRVTRPDDVHRTARKAVKS
jgi:hypothetical protein